MSGISPAAFFVIPALRYNVNIMINQAPSFHLVLENVTRSFEEAGARRHVLQQLTLDIARGERVLLLGRSGSGKSTLLNLIAGIDAPDSGRISIDNVEVSALNEEARTLFRRRHIGMVFQFFNLLPTLTVMENVLLPLQLDQRVTSRTRHRAMELLDAVALSDRASSMPELLSGGEQQRVAIIRALLGEPSLILADEPTGNLDARTGATVLELLFSLHRSHGSTLIMATHGHEALPHADRILDMHDGTVREVSVEDVIRHEEALRSAAESSARTQGIRT